MIPTVILLSALLVWTSEAFSPKEEEKKTPEKELEAAIAKYLEGKRLRSKHMNTTDDTTKSLTDRSSGRFGAILEEIQPAEQNIVTLFNPYFRGKKRDILPFALNLYKQGSLEGERQILDSENIPFVASWSMKSCFIPVGSNHCRIQFNRNPELSYELLIVNYQLVDYLIDVIVNYRQKRGVDFSKSFYFQMLQIEL